MNLVWAIGCGELLELRHNNFVVESFDIVDATAIELGILQGLGSHHGCEVLHNGSAKPHHGRIVLIGSAQYGHKLHNDVYTGVNERRTAETLELACSRHSLSDEVLHHGSRRLAGQSHSALHAVEPYGIAGQSALVEIDAVAQTEYGRIDDHHAASGDVLRNGNPQVVEVRHLVGQKPIQLLQQRRVIGGIDVERTGHDQRVFPVQAGMQRRPGAGRLAIHSAQYELGHALGRVGLDHIVRGRQQSVFADRAEQSFALGGIGHSFVYRRQPCRIPLLDHVRGAQQEIANHLGLGVHRAALMDHVQDSNRNAIALQAELRLGIEEQHERVVQLAAQAQAMRMALEGPTAICDGALEAGAFAKQLSAGMPGLNQFVHAIRIDLLLPVEILELQLVEMQDAHPAEQSSSTLQRKLHGQVRRRHGPHDAVAGHVRHSAEDRLAGQLTIEEHGIMGEVPADALARRQSLLLGRDDDFGTGQRRSDRTWSS